MKTILSAAAALFSVCLCAETLVAHWDFSKGLDPQKSAVKTKLRGKGAIVTQGKTKFLRVNGDGKVAGGATTLKAEKILSPGAFRAEITFVLNKGKSPSVNQFLLDSKYVPYPHKNPVYNKGFLLYLTKVGKPEDNKYFPYAGVGLGKTSLTFRGNVITLKPGQKCTLSFSWNGKDTAEFKVDSKVNFVQKGVKDGAPMAPAAYPLSIGDRYSSGFSPLNGDVFDVKIFDLAK